MSFKSKQEILIIGDIMLDVYQHVDVNRISSESPTPICDVKDTSYRLGGAGNVAANIASLGGIPHLIGRIGSDDEGDILQNIMSREGIIYHPEYNNPDNYRTMMKVRTISDHHHIIRHDFGEGQKPIDINSSFLKRIGNKIRSLSKKIKAIVISDYNKGVINSHIWKCITLNSYSIPIFIDTKRKFIEFKSDKRIFAIKPNAKEFKENAEFMQLIDMNDILEIVLENLNYNKGVMVYNMLVTLGRNGMILGSLTTDGYKSWQIEPTQKLNVYDVTGAGDTAMAAFVMACVSGHPIDIAAKIANIASGIACSKIGTSTVSIGELMEANAFESKENQNEPMCNMPKKS